MAISTWRFEFCSEIQFPDPFKTQFIPTPFKPHCVLSSFPVFLDILKPKMCPYDNASGRFEIGFEIRCKKHAFLGGSLQHLLKKKVVFQQWRGDISQTDQMDIWPSFHRAWHRPLKGGGGRQDMNGPERRGEFHGGWSQATGWRWCTFGWVWSSLTSTLAYTLITEKYVRNSNKILRARKLWESEAAKELRMKT